MKLKVVLIVCIFSFELFAANPLDLRSTLNALVGSNKTITLPKGEYQLDMSGNLQSYVFDGLQNLVIDGNGSSILCNRQTRAFDFLNCTNVTFKNFCIDYQPLCFSQGVITSISTDRKTWEVRIFNGYPYSNINNDKMDVFDASTKKLKNNYKTFYTASFTISLLGNNRILININESSGGALAKVSDLVTLNCDGIGAIRPHCIYSESCKNMKFQNDTIFGSNSFSMFESDCENSLYQNCVITRKTNDPTVEIPRLRAGNADGIHSKHAVIGPTIEGCKIEYNDDDCIAINGRFYPIYKVDATAKRIYLMSTDKLVDVKVKLNDSIVCVDNDGHVKGNSKIQDITSAVMSASERQACINYFLGGLHNETKYQNGIVITLSQWVTGLKSGDLIYSKQRTGCGFTVRNNNVGRNRSRGILIKASNGVIEGNTVEGCQLAGIILSPEFYWMEAGCSSNVSITNNTVKNVLYGSSSAGQRQPGAISVTSVNGSSVFSPSGVFNNITISGNSIENCPQPCIVVTSGSNIQITGNTINTNLSMVRTHGSSLGVKNNVIIWTTNLDSLFTDSINKKKDEPVSVFVDAFKNMHLRPAIGTIVQKVILYDHAGRKIKNVLNKNTSGEIILSMDECNRGCYVITYFSEKSAHSLKFMY
ncbi:MAG: hypothetical protein GZ091_15620 [Paludibacter sp.]|nr:hypothetical protein [Paludibacter sp.]